jgi:hypothetical protein
MYWLKVVTYCMEILDSHCFYSWWFCYCFRFSYRCCFAWRLVFRRFFYSVIYIVIVLIIILILYICYGRGLYVIQIKNAGSKWPGRLIILIICFITNWLNKFFFIISILFFIVQFFNLNFIILLFMCIIFSSIFILYISNW